MIPQAIRFLGQTIIMVTTARVVNDAIDSASRRARERKRRKRGGDGDSNGGS
jgi:hypothetical protein